jgi:glutamate-1-semialdehyde aminotransferase
LPEATSCGALDHLLGAIDIVDPTTGKPFVVQSASGAIVTDVSGREFVDLVNGGGSLTLGHADPEVTAAVVEAVTSIGPFNGGLTRLHGEVVDLLRDAARQDFDFAFFSSGSEAVVAVLHAYRDRQARPLVAAAGYHGWSAVWEASDRRLEPNASGVIDFFFDLDMLEDCLRRHGSRIGCVVLAPDHTYFDRDYYASFFRLMETTDAVVCIDDVMHGFRRGTFCSLQSFIERIGAITLAKTLGNGHRVSAVAGRARELPGLRQISSSFALSVTEFAAMRATLAAYRERRPFERIAADGLAFLAALRPVISASGLPLEVIGDGALFRLVCAADLEAEILEQMWRQGVILAGADTQKPSAATTSAVFTRVLAAFEVALSRIKGAPRARELPAISTEDRMLSAWYVIHGLAPGLGVDSAAVTERMRWEWNVSGSTRTPSSSFSGLSLR